MKLLLPDSRIGAKKNIAKPSVKQSSFNRSLQLVHDVTRWKERYRSVDHVISDMFQRKNLGKKECLNLRLNKRLHVVDDVITTMSQQQVPKKHLLTKAQPNERHQVVGDVIGGWYRQNVLKKKEFATRLSHARNSCGKKEALGLFKDTNKIGEASPKYLRNAALSATPHNKVSLGNVLDRYAYRSSAFKTYSKRLKWIYHFAQVGGKEVNEAGNVFEEDRKTRKKLDRSYIEILAFNKPSTPRICKLAARMNCNTCLQREKKLKKEKNLENNKQNVNLPKTFKEKCCFKAKRSIFYESTILNKNVSVQKDLRHSVEAICRCIGKGSFSPGAKHAVTLLPINKRNLFRNILSKRRSAVQKKHAFNHETAKCSGDREMSFNDIAAAVKGITSSAIHDSVMVLKSLAKDKYHALCTELFRLRKLLVQFIISTHKVVIITAAMIFFYHILVNYVNL